MNEIAAHLNRKQSPCLVTDRKLLHEALVVLRCRGNFGIAAVERICNVEYGQAFKIVDRGITLGLLSRLHPTLELTLTNKAKRIVDLGLDESQC